LIFVDSFIAIHIDINKASKETMNIIMFVITVVVFIVYSQVIQTQLQKIITNQTVVPLASCRWKNTNVGNPTPVPLISTLSSNLSTASINLSSLVVDESRNANSLSVSSGNIIISTSGTYEIRFIGNILINNVNDVVMVGYTNNAGDTILGAVQFKYTGVPSTICDISTKVLLSEGDVIKVFGIDLTNSGASLIPGALSIIQVDS
jgi:hypothetical protein